MDIGKNGYSIHFSSSITLAVSLGASCEQTVITLVLDQARPEMKYVYVLSCRTSKRPKDMRKKCIRSLPVKEGIGPLTNYLFAMSVAGYSFLPNSCQAGVGVSDSVTR